MIRVKELIASGAIGEPVFAQMIASEPFDPRPGGPRGWLVQRAQSGGGPMADFGCHRLEVLAAPARSGRAGAGRRRDRRARSRSGRHRGDAAAVRSRRLRDGRGDQRRVRPSGHARHLRDAWIDSRWPRSTAATSTVRIGDSAARSSRIRPPANVHVPLVEEFVDAVRSGRDPAVDGSAGRAVAAIQDEIYADATTIR